MNKLLIISAISLIVLAGLSGCNKNVNAEQSPIKQVHTETFELVLGGGWKERRGFKWTPEENPNVRCMWIKGHMEASITCYNVETN